MPQFSFSKVKLKDIESIGISTENMEGNLYVLFDIKLRNGKTKLGGGIRVVDFEKAHSRTTRVSLKLPEASSWEKLKPDELTVNLGILSATWKTKK